MSTTEDTCESCGERNPAGSAFCLFCGAYLGWNEDAGDVPERLDPAPETEQVAPAEHPPTAARGPAPDPTTQPVAAASTTSASTTSATRSTASAPVPPAGPPSEVVSAAPPCPACGHRNDATRRFCGRCGQVLVQDTAGSTLPVAPRQRGPSWWHRFRDPADRAARRNWRKSRSTGQRARRFLVGLLVVAVVVAVAFAATHHPVSWVRARWYDFTNTTVTIPDVTAAAVPKGSVANHYTVEDVAANVAIPRPWATHWPKGTVDQGSCGASGVGAIRLTFQPTRIRGIDIVAGLADVTRTSQYRPETLAIAYPHHGCVRLRLQSTPDAQRIMFDTQQPVSSLVVSVQSAYPPSAGAKNPKNLVAITHIALLARPS